MSLEDLQSKIRNAQKRFRQGRITYKKLQSIVQACRQEAMVLVSKEVAEQKQEHIHTEDCDHTLDEGSMEDSAFVDYVHSDEPHVHGEHCKH
jgi:hypothetical protein